jgi:hypothetical protein
MLSVVEWCSRSRMAVVITTSPSTLPTVEEAFVGGMDQEVSRSTDNTSRNTQRARLSSRVMGRLPYL